MIHILVKVFRKNFEQKYFPSCFHFYVGQNYYLTDNDLKFGSWLPLFSQVNEFEHT